MSHEHFQELVSEFVDRELSAEAEKVLFVHLAECDECREFLRESVRLNAELIATKVRTLIAQQAAHRPTQAANRPAVVGTRPQSRYARIRAFAFLTIVIVVTSVFWSMTLQRQTEEQWSMQREALPREMPNYQP